VDALEAAGDKIKRQPVTIASFELKSILRVLSSFLYDRG
jgi:hypothetical protein